MVGAVPTVTRAVDQECRAVPGAPGVQEAPVDLGAQGDQVDRADPGRESLAESTGPVDQVALVDPVVREVPVVPAGLCLACPEVLEVPGDPEVPADQAVLVGQEDPSAFVPQVSVPSEPQGRSPRNFPYCIGKI